MLYIYNKFIVRIDFFQLKIIAGMQMIVNIDKNVVSTPLTPNLGAIMQDIDDESKTVKVKG